jgi:beta-glucuronidase
MISLWLVAGCGTAHTEDAGLKPAHVTVQKSKDGWRLLVNGQPFFVKGMVYNPMTIGESSYDGTVRDWMIVDDDKDGRNDFAYQSWVDANRNNKRDPDEKDIGDFQLLKDMGCNAVRIYHHASDDPEIMALNPGNLLFNHPPNKALLRELFDHYGIRVMMGDLLGSYTAATGATWENGTDYRDPVQRKNMLKSVETMVKDFKDEPFLLMWALGNENNYSQSTHTNADKYPEDYAKFVNEAAELIHRLDPNHPVSIVSGSTNLLDAYAKFAPAVDIFGLNDYRPFDFGDMWERVAKTYDKPVMFTEFGTGLPPVENGQMREDKQAAVHRSNWNDIAGHAAGKMPPGNSIGGFVFVWLDDWWEDGQPLVHDLMPNGWHHEWNGMAGQGDGKNSPLLRELRQVYHTYKELWAETGTR